MPDFIPVRRKNAVDPEAGTVLHHDHRLADAPAELVLRYAAPLQPIVEDRARGEDSLRDSGQVGVLHADVHFRLRDGGARDPRAHEPRTDDAEAMNSDRRWRIGNAGVLLELIRSKEDLNQFARDIGDGELTEELRLPFQPLGDAVAHAVLDRLERSEWGRIMPAGFLQDLFPSGAIDAKSAQRIAIEQETHDATATLALRSPAAGHPSRGTDRDLSENCGRDQLVDHSQTECFG